MGSWTIYLTRQAHKELARLPARIRDIVYRAIADMELQGFAPPGWDVRKTSDHEYRLRITYRYRMRYRQISAHTLEIEIFYVGHRRDAYR